MRVPCRKKRPWSATLCLPSPLPQRGATGLDCWPLRTAVVEVAVGLSTSSSDSRSIATGQVPVPCRKESRGQLRFEPCLPSPLPQRGATGLECRPLCTLVSLTHWVRYSAHTMSKKRPRSATLCLPSPLPQRGATGLECWPLRTAVVEVAVGLSTSSSDSSSIAT